MIAVEWASRIARNTDASIADRRYFYYECNLCRKYNAAKIVTAAKDNANAVQYGGRQLSQTQNAHPIRNVCLFKDIKQ